jgi:hypothetical protein
MLQGASLENAWLAGASLVRTQMQGALLRNTGLLGANLESAIMHGAIFEEARLHGTTFYRTELQGALFQNAVFEGTVFVQAQMQGVQVLQSDFKAGQLHAGALRASIVSGSYLWNAGSIKCDLTHIASPNFEPIVEAGYSATEEGVSAFVEQSLNQLPDESEAARAFKAKLRNDLKSRLSPPASSPNEETWRDCARKSEKHRDTDFSKLAASVVSYACGLPNLDQFAMAFATGAAPATAVSNGATAKPATRWAASELRQIPLGTMFATSMLEMDEKRCPNIASLTEPTKKLLQYVKGLQD